MAGIGFQLRKILGKGDLGSTVGALISGVFIVAGPWLISVLAMAILQTLFSRYSVPRVEVFQVVIIYCYAFSLSLFAGIHHLFTRLVADLAWEDRNGEAASWMLRFVALTALLAAAISLPVMFLVPVSPELAPGLLRVSGVLLFMAVNVTWIVLLFISLLKDYRIILGVFALGMAASVGGALSFGQVWGPGGAVLGYALGMTLIDILFILVALLRHPPEPVRDGWIRVWTYARRYRALILSGICFYGGQWLDKFVFWLIRGQTVEGTPFRIYAEYDIAVYIAGLSVIPGLVYFIIIAETQLYTDLRHFLFTLNHASWLRIQEAKGRLSKGMIGEMRDQLTLQAACTLGLATVILVLRPAGLTTPAMALALLAALFQFTLLTLLVYLYYFELYARALVAAFLYALLNGLGTIGLYSAFPWLPAGLSHVLAGIVGSLAAVFMLRGAVFRLDKIIFRRVLKV